MCGSCPYAAVFASRKTLVGGQLPRIQAKADLRLSLTVSGSYAVAASKHAQVTSQACQVSRPCTKQQFSVYIAFNVITRLRAHQQQAKNCMAGHVSAVRDMTPSHILCISTDCRGWRRGRLFSLQAFAADLAQSRWYTLGFHCDFIPTRQHACSGAFTA